MKRIPWFNNDFTRCGAEISRAIAQRSISHGDECNRLEDELGSYLGKPCKVVSSGTVALWVIFMFLAQSIKKRNAFERRPKILIQERTWIATMNAAVLAGFEPVVVPMDADYTGIDLTKFRTKIKQGDIDCVVVTHMNGRVRGLSQIVEWCSQNDIPLVEDNAQALGSSINKQVTGTFGFASALSFSVTKLVSGGQGGAVVTQSDALLEFVDMMRFQGGKSRATITSGKSFDYPGFNIRYSDLLASAVRSQLAEVELRIQRVRDIYHAYKSIIVPSESIEILNNTSDEVPIYVEALVENRSEFTNEMLSEGIECRPFYPGIQSSTYFHDKLSIEGCYPYSKGVYLPCGPSMPIADAEFVAEHIVKFNKKRGKF